MTLVATVPSGNAVLNADTSIGGSLTSITVNVPPRV